MARGHATARPMMSTRVSGRSVGSVRGVRATHRLVTFTRSPYRTVAEEKGTVVGRRVVFQLQAVSDGDVPGEEWFLDGNLQQRVHRQVEQVDQACGEHEGVDPGTALADDPGEAPLMQCLHDLFRGPAAGRGQLRTRRLELLATLGQ